MTRRAGVLHLLLMLFLLSLLQGCGSSSSTSARVYYGDPWAHDYYYRTRIYYHYHDWDYDRPNRPKPPPNVRPPRPEHPIARPPRPDRPKPPPNVRPPRPEHPIARPRPSRPSRPAARPSRGGRR